MRTKTKCLSYYGRFPESQTNQVSVFSWNILAKDYVTEERYGSLPQHMTWEYRFRKLKEQLTACNADIVCLQEVSLSSAETEMVDFFRGLGYEGKVQEKDHVIGVATFYKVSKFTFGWVESRSRAMIMGLNMIAGAGTIPIQIANVHLEGSPTQAVKRFHQMRSLLRRLEAHTSQDQTPEEEVIFICGDFNTETSGGAVVVLEQGSLEPEFVEQGTQTTSTPFVHPFKFVNAYQKAEAIHPTYLGNMSSVIDHMFHTKKHTDTIGTFSIKQKDLSEAAATKIPNSTFPSDHLPVGALFQLHQKVLQTIRKKEPFG